MTDAYGKTVTCPVTIAAGPEQVETLPVDVKEGLVKYFVESGKTQAQAEELVRTMNIPKPKPINDLRITTAKDVKVFKNTVKRAVDLMKKSGIDAKIEENSFEWGTEYIIKIKKADKK